MSLMGDMEPSMASISLESTELAKRMLRGDLRRCQEEGICEPMFVSWFRFWLPNGLPRLETSEGSGLTSVPNSGSRGFGCLVGLLSLPGLGL